MFSIPPLSLVRMPAAPEVAPAPVIGEDEDDVGTRCAGSVGGDVNAAEQQGEQEPFQVVVHCGGLNRQTCGLLS